MKIINITIEIVDTDTGELELDDIKRKILAGHTRGSDESVTGNSYYFEIEAKSNN